MDRVRSLDNNFWWRNLVQRPGGWWFDVLEKIGYFEKVFK
jgi:hypothetical protein